MEEDDPFQALDNLRANLKEAVAGLSSLTAEQREAAAAIQDASGKAEGASRKAVEAVSAIRGMIMPASGYAALCGLLVGLAGVFAGHHWGFNDGWAAREREKVQQAEATKLKSAQDLRDVAWVHSPSGEMAVWMDREGLLPRFALCSLSGYIERPDPSHDDAEFCVPLSGYGPRWRAYVHQASQDASSGGP